MPFQQESASPEPDRLPDLMTEAHLSEQAFRTLADFIPHIVWTTRPNGVLDYCNRRFYEYTGIDLKATTLNEDWSRSIHPDDLEPAHQRWKECIRTGEAYEAEIRVRQNSTQRYRRHLARAVPLSDDTSKLINKWFGICIDIEDLKRSEERTLFQTRVNTALGSSLEVGETLQQIAHLCVPELADWCRIDVLDENGRQRTEVVAHKDPEKERLLKAIVEHSNIQDTFIYETVGYGTSLMVPLVGHNGTLGAFMLVAIDPHRIFSEEERDIAEVLGRRAGVAIENSQIFEREHRIATTLQRALLPAQLPVVSGIAMDWEYRPATQESQVGGDWYDAFLLPDKSLFISIGDVCGHGLDAAIAMSTIRQSLRSLAFECPEPWLVLEGINRILQCEQNETIATAIFARFDPQTLHLEYASAGHPAPILMDEPHTPFLLSAGGMPLGILPLGNEIARHAVDLKPGTTLCFYTDGLIEFSRDVMREEDRLLHEIGKLSPLDRTPATTIVDRMLGNAQQKDDIAVLVLQTEEPPLESVDVALPSVPASASLIRRLVRRFIRAHALNESDGFRLLTACGEAVANAAEYAYNESPEALRLTASYTMNNIEVVIHDSGKQSVPTIFQSSVEHASPGGGSEQERGRGLLLMHALSNDVRIEQRDGGTDVHLRFQCRQSRKPPTT
jgi:serine/threonine-protein kinase RsbW